MPPALGSAAEKNHGWDTASFVSINDSVLLSGLAPFQENRFHFFVSQSCRLLRRNLASGHTRKHPRNDKAAEDLINRCARKTRIPDTFRPKQSVSQDVVFARGYRLRITGQLIEQVGNRLREAREITELAGMEDLHGIT